MERMCIDMKTRSVLLLLVVLGGASAAPASEVEQAQALLRSSKEALRLAQEAQLRGDMTTAGRLYPAAQEKLEEARRLFDEADAASSSDPGVLVDYAEVLSGAADHDLAASALRRATELDPANAPAWLALGQSLLRLGGPHFREAAAAFRQAIKLAAGSALAADAHGYLGMLFHKESLHDLAREEYAQAVKLKPASYIGRIGLVALDVGEGNMVVADRALVAVGSVPPQFVPMLRGSLGEALDDFEESGRWFRDDPEAHAAYARLLMQVDRLEESLIPMRRAVALAPEEPEYWNLLAQILKLCNDVPGAIQACEKSLLLDPNQPPLKQFLDYLQSSPNPPAR